MTQIVITDHRYERIEAKANSNTVALVQRFHPGFKYKVITLNWKEALKLARFIQSEARKEVEKCRTLRSELEARSLLPTRADPG